MTNPLIITLPLIAAIIGWFTNYIAVKMLFRPYRPVRIGPLVVQGIFPKRQQLVAEKIGRLVSEELLSLHDIKEQISHPENIQMINRKIESKIEDYLSTTFPANYPWMALFIRKKTKEKLKNDFLEEVDELAPQIVAQYIANMEGKLDIEKIIVEKISNLSPQRLERLIMQVLEREFRFIELIGAAIGFVIGLIQIGLVLI
ncbi:MAG: membrane protein [Chitinophagales bacterium]|nr:MAG: membrane protein [Chitinophagales bacterium]